MEQANDLAFVQQCVRQGRLLWTYHATMRLRKRGISRQMVVESVDTYEVIESYAQSKASRYLPSCLVRAEYHGEPFHALFALDRESNYVRVITVYYPDPQIWEEGFRRRKET